MAKPIDWRDYISINPDVCHGKPCIKGHRIMVADIIGLLESGAPLKEIRRDFPGVTAKHIQAALQFARQAIEGGRYIPFRRVGHAAVGR